MRPRAALRNHRVPLAAVLSAVLVIGVLTGDRPGIANAAPDPSRAVDAESGYVMPPIEWTVCSEPDSPYPEAECGDAYVPLDYERPDGALTSIALVRVRANGTPEQRIGTLFVDPGGPGGSGTDFADYEAGSLSPEMRRAFDVIGIDPRGVGGSRPAPLCATADAGPVPDAADVAAWRTYVEAFEQLNVPFETSCMVANAAWFTHAGTVTVARDLDLLRQAVGDEKLTYHGISYGTRLGSVYAQMFPDRVRAMILDGNMDPLGDVPSFFLRGPATESAFGQFRSWNPGAGVQYDQILEVLAEGPVSVPGGELTSVGVRSFVGSAMSAESGWPELAARIAEVHSVVVDGGSAEDVDPFSDDVAEPAFVDPVGEDTDGEDGGVDDPSPVFWAVMCQDNTARPTNEQYAVAAADQVAQAPSFGFQSGAMVPICAGSPVPTRAIPRMSAVATVPVLLVQSLHDPATPYEWGEAMLATMPTGSRMVVYEGATHGMYAVGNSPCVTAVGDAYLLDGALPSSTVTCPFVPPT